MASAQFFLQHNAGLVVLGHCLLVAVIKFQLKINLTFQVNKTGLMANISIKYVVPTCIW